MLRRVYAELTVREIFIRGAISYGDHFFNDNILISPAFIDAYEHEEKVSLYPRIIATQSFMKQLYLVADKMQDSKKATSQIDLLMKLDSDGFRFVNYLPFYTLDLITGEGMSNKITEPTQNGHAFISRHKELIEKQLINSNPAIKAKYIWLGNYHNKFLEHETKWTNKEFYMISKPLLEQVSP